MHRKVSCIIPAYNEEKTVGGVVKVCLEVPEIEEIIVVSDGSSDGTGEKIKKLGNEKIKLIELKENRGKGFAVAEGLRVAKNNFVLFLDADLINLEVHFLSSLIWPVVEGRVDMAIAGWYDRRINSSFWKLNGQRCLNSKFLEPHLRDIRNSRYGLEILLNEIFRRRRVVVIPWISEKPLHLLKREKNSEEWMLSYIREIFDIAKMFLKNKTSSYKRRFLTGLTETMASYFKVSVEKIKEFLEI